MQAAGSSTWPPPASARLGPSPPSTLAGWPHGTSTARPTEPHRGKAAEPQRPGPRGGCSPASPRALLVSPSSVRLRLLGPRGPTVPVAGASGSHNRAWPLLQGHSRLQTNLEVCHCPRSGDLRRVPQTSAGPGAKADSAHSPHCPATALKQQMALALVTTRWPWPWSLLPPPPGTLPGLCRRLSKGLVVTACEEGQRGLLRPRRGARVTDAGSQAASRPWPPRPSSMTFTQEVFSVWTNLCEPKDEGNESSRRAAGERAGGQPWPRGVRERRGPLSPRCLLLTVLRGIARGSAGLTVTSCRAWLTGAGASRPPRPPPREGTARGH